MPPGSGFPPHIHSREEELFLVLEKAKRHSKSMNRLSVKAHSSTCRLEASTVFRNESIKTARLLISLAPAGLEKMFFGAETPLDNNADTAPPHNLTTNRQSVCSIDRDHHVSADLFPGQTVQRPRSSYYQRQTWHFSRWLGCERSRPGTIKHAPIEPLLARHHLLYD